MEEEFAIRPAHPTPADAEALLRVERECLGDSPYSPEGILALIGRRTHRTYVAVHTAEGRVVGFCSCFRTPAGAGVRLEIDLLAVLSAHRGRGLGSRLIARAIEGGRVEGIRRYRGIVAEDNVASQRAFRRAGLGPRSSCELLVYRIRGTSPVALPVEGWSYGVDPPDAAAADHSLEPRTVLRVRDARGREAGRADCLHVHTLSYEGLWVEGPRAAHEIALRALARAAVEHAKGLGVDEVGHLLPVQEGQGDGPRLVAWVREGYERLGTYLVFELGE